MFSKKLEFFFSIFPLFLAIAILQEERSYPLLLIGLLFYVFSSLWGLSGLLLSSISYALFFSIPTTQDFLFYSIAAVSGFILFLCKSPLPTEQKEKEVVRALEEELELNIKSAFLQDMEDDLHHKALIRSLQESQKQIMDLEEEIRLLEELVTKAGFVSKPVRRKKEEKGQIFFQLEDFPIEADRNQ